MNLETARRVIEADRQQQQNVKNAELRAYVGRFFKYRNSYGGGEDWWMYGAPRKVSDYGHVTGLTFQRTAHNIIEIESNGAVGVGGSFGGSWIEITPREFWAAAKKLTMLVDKTMHRGRPGERPAP